jgi:hypothetical protein
MKRIMERREFEDLYCRVCGERLSKRVYYGDDDDLYAIDCSHEHQSWMRRCDMSKDLKRLTEREQDLREVVDALPHFWPARYELASNLAAQGKCVEALEEARKLPNMPAPLNDENRQKCMSWVLIAMIYLRLAQDTVGESDELEKWHSYIREAETALGRAKELRGLI